MSGPEGGRKRGVPGRVSRAPWLQGASAPPTVPKETVIPRDAPTALLASEWPGGRGGEGVRPQRALSGTARPASGQRRTTLTRPVSRGVARPDWRPRHQLRLCESCPRQPGMCQEWRCDDLMR